MLNAKILLLEDDLVTAKALLACLRRQGHQLFHTADVTEAMRMVRINPPDLVIVDVHLPEIDPLNGPRLDGIGFVQWLNQMTESPIPVIVHSSDDPQTVRQKAKTCQIAAFLQKPISAIQLIDTVRDTLSGLTENNS